MSTSSYFIAKQDFSTKERWLKWNHHHSRSIAPFLLSSFILTSLLCLVALYSSSYTSNYKSLFVFDDKHGLAHNNTLLHHYGEDGNRRCDIFKGQWIHDLNATSYTNYSCQTIPESRNCLKNGREDVDFLNWKWKPQDCDLPKFDAKSFMQIVRGKKLAFIGDSVARNQVESLLCLLSQEEASVVAYKEADDRSRTWRFPSNNFTLMVLWTRFLVAEEEIITNGTNSGNFNLHLDKVDIEWANKIQDLDFAIISSGHWFFRKLYMYQNNVLTGCVFCNEPNITEKGLANAIRESFRTAFRFINGCNECKKGVTTLLRTFSPAHFEHGAWNDGGVCNRTSPQHQPDEKSVEHILELRNVQFEEIDRARRESIGRKKGENRFEILDVTKAMLMRPDGHPGAFSGNKWMKGFSDCIHWCLPGPVDMWNQLLMAMLQSGI